MPRRRTLAGLRRGAGSDDAAARGRRAAGSVSSTLNRTLVYAFGCLIDSACTSFVLWRRQRQSVRAGVMARLNELLASSLRRKWLRRPCDGVPSDRLIADFVFSCRESYHRCSVAAVRVPVLASTPGEARLARFKELPFWRSPASRSSLATVSTVHPTET